MLEAAARLTERGDAGERFLEGSGVVLLAARIDDVRRARLSGFVAQLPRGVYWKMPFLPPVESQLATVRRRRPCPMR